MSRSKEGGVYRSDDRGASWTQVTDFQPIINRPFYYCNLEAHPKDPDILWGMAEGQWKSVDGGKTWKEIMRGLPYQKWVSELVASAYDLSTVYMTQNGKRDDDFAAYVWKSTNYGITWVDISGNIPLGPVNVIKEDPLNKDILYVGTDIGVYVTTDGGKKWDILGGNLPSTFVQDMIIHPRENIIVIATHGRGMWAMDANPVNKKE